MIFFYFFYVYWDEKYLAVKQNISETFLSCNVSIFIRQHLVLVDFAL